ncbi:chaplin family protein [Streptomyces sp. NPDC053750]|uniref:chaplin family protein n=1 Tax=Streptomyces sp. NPDC053750 TaxID=3365714 RepID=UPI0037D0E2E1
MRQTLSRGVLAAAAATGILSLTSAPALADSIAVGTSENADGVASGNIIQAPVHAPVNVCGNAVNALAALNSTHDNSCGNTSQGVPSAASSAASSSESSTTGSRAGGSQAVGSSENADGVASGNVVQAPVNVPVNVCGNAVNVAAALNDTYGNSCGNTSQDAYASSYGTSSTRGSEAVGTSEGAYGLLSGNVIQAPVHAPVNVCGNAVNVASVLNDTYGNSCYNEETGYGTEEMTPPTTGTPATPPPPTRVVDTPPSVGVEVPEEPPHLAETGSEGMLVASAAGAALLMGGAVLYRRGRSAARR